MADPFDSPVDVETDDSGLSGLGQMVVAVAVAVFTLTVFNAHALAAWADTLEPGPRSAQIGAIAHGLADKTAAAGMDRPRAALHGQWERVKAARWPDQAGAE
ncbi:hypothetical protein [Sandarakinorhabdus sp.]|uniref:hypothetical protein n=1 Tax=Sandarakinorhabdus sp. TaxID=1916663 RepID=UPI00286E49B8|nr:hypothetical protein [Sandarakinorhabdus sp.]